jgi:large subunit ribosomal protein L21e
VAKVVGKKAKGKRKKTRCKLRRKAGMLGVKSFLAELSLGTKVHIDIDSAVHSGMPDAHFQGLTGVVIGRQGRAFNVEVRKGDAVKRIIVHPAHLKAAGKKSGDAEAIGGEAA